jgi:hypothetical protein
MQKRYQDQLVNEAPKGHIVTTSRGGKGRRSEMGDGMNYEATETGTYASTPTNSNTLAVARKLWTSDKAAVKS